jgi:hypothetical protein
MYKNSNRLIYLWLLIILNSCRPTKESVSGVYIFIDKHNPEFMEAVHLYKDGTYNFQSSTTFASEPKVHGTWQITGHTIILGQSNKIIDTPTFEDTIQVKKITYKLKWGNLKHYMHRLHRYRTLKKVRKPFKTFILNYEKF